MLRRKAVFKNEKLIVKLTTSQSYNKEDAIKVLRTLKEQEKNIKGNLKAYKEASRKMKKDLKKIRNDLAFFKRHAPEWYDGEALLDRNKGQEGIC